MARDHDRIVLHASWAATGPGNVDKYFVCDRPLRVKSLQVIGINPGSTDGDTLAVAVDYSTNGFSGSTSVGAVAAAEYNDTDNTLALTALTPNEKIAEGAFTNERIPAGAAIRIRHTWAGTVADGDVETVLLATTV